MSIERIKIMLDDGAKMPTRAHATDAGLDLYSMNTLSKCINGGESFTFDTGVHVDIPDGFVGMVKSRSGLMVKYDLFAEGVVDAGYTGSIRVHLRNNGKKPYVVEYGERIAQLVIMPIEIPTIEIVKKLDETDRSDNGFGSTGRH